MDERRVCQVGSGGEVTAAWKDPLELRRSLGDLLGPSALAAEVPAAVAELVKVTLGRSEVTLDAKDARFTDPAWRDHPGYRRLGQSYRVWEQTLERLVTRTGSAGRDRQQRARFLADILSGALAPTNVLPGNPAALKRAFDTGGLSVARGVRNLVRDAVTNGGMPRMVDSRPFEVGRNLACTPGAVVYREEMFEVLQYTPSTPTVRSRPLVVIPPQLNRYYVLDLSPGRSVVEYAIAHGVQTFMVVWRNPRPEHGGWALDDYLKAMLRVIEVVQSISGSDDLNWFGLCAGGATSALLLGHLAEIGESPIKSATFLVTMLDSRCANMVGTLATPGVREVVGKDAAEGKIYGSRAVARNFAWMRPNDLVFRYVVNGWLLGNDPPSFDLLAWNDDATRITAAFERDSLDVLATDKATRPGEVTVLGTPIDLSRVDIDSFHVAGQKDHITTWRPCYLTSQLLGGNSEMVLTDSGHIQSFVNPPDESRYHYWTASAIDAEPDTWLAKATRNDGSWWPRWIEWLLARSGSETPSPSDLGNDLYPPGDAAPGRYVHEK